MTFKGKRGKRDFGTMYMVAEEDSREDQWSGCSAWDLHGGFADRHAAFVNDL